MICLNRYFENNMYIMTIVFLIETTGLQIINVDVPAVIQNGTRDSVVLDCEYWYEQYEEDGLELKWFWNDEPEAVYQWIPGELPEAIGILKGRVNLQHRASKDPSSTHRALEILFPTTDLSGTFTCRVSSFHDEDAASREMIVYAPASSMNLTFVKSGLDSVTFNCSASSVFPEPLLKFHLLNDHSQRQEHLTVESNVNIDGTFNVSARATFLETSLPKETLLQCLLEVPGTQYRIRRQVVYFPGYFNRGFSGSLSLRVSALLTYLAASAFLSTFIYNMQSI